MTIVPPPADPMLDDGTDEDLSFGRAIVVGSAIGIVVMTALLVLVLRLVWPDQPWGATIGVAAWTGVWAGLFLGGTVTVGRWSSQRH